MKLNLLNTFLLVAGIALLAVGYLQYLGRHETPNVKAALAMMTLVPGWALVTMGYVGLHCRKEDEEKDQS
jgi:hypothetical protein